MSTTDTATPLPTPQPTTPSSSSQPVNANKSSEWSKSKKSSYAKPLTEYDIFLNKFSLLQYPSSYRLERASDINRIDHYVETLLSQGTRFGLDMEWEPTFNKGARQNKTALIQICSANAILIIQTSKFKKLPRKLEEFLQDRTKYKSGVNIRNDGLKLYRDFGVLTNGLVELTTMAVQSNFERMRLTDRRSLQALTAIFLEKKMLKGPVQLSKWGSSILTDRQIKYAANDAYASYQIFEELHQLHQTADPLKQVSAIHLEDEIVISKRAQKTGKFTTAQKVSAVKKAVEENTRIVRREKRMSISAKDEDGEDIQRVTTETEEVITETVKSGTEETVKVQSTSTVKVVKTSVSAESQEEEALQLKKPKAFAIRRGSQSTVVRVRPIKKE